MARPEDGTGAGLLAFLDMAAQQGDLSAATSSAFKSAVKSVLLVAGDPKSVDIRTLNVNSTFNRFETQYGSGYAPDSLPTYRSRFRRSVAMYLAWLDNDPGWKRADRSTPSRKPANEGRVSQGNRSSAESEARPEAAQSAPGPRMITYQLPLRPDVIIPLTLPVKLTRADANRIATFVSGLAFDDVPTTPSRNRDDDDAGSGGE
ncbi:hypothetical protein [Parafrankia sp. EUN1f]|uniref:hypothetical protein n=1 Tax=Parafrankia sp. EUN1f TaxID=102897 RepID=UPI0001C44A6E|nr:hypothetical protein [Parafrankia sp. EUN1f]EFC84485.1 hypothetical protein FrEUN1fDRAFT_2415 [Parafrankia sp. EUN1f]